MAASERGEGSRAQPRDGQKEEGRGRDGVSASRAVERRDGERREVSQKIT